MNKYVRIQNVHFKGKRNIKWDMVEKYIKGYSGQKYKVMQYGDIVAINALSADEYANSKYTEKLKGALAKVKANMATVIPELIENAYDRRWTENKSKKHEKDASKGWYRYDVGVEFPVKAVEEDKVRWNKYRATMIVRKNDSGLTFYDIINIKKEASTPPES